MLGRIFIVLLALVGLAALASAGFYFALKRPDIPFATLAAKYETADSRYADLPNGVRMHYFDIGPDNAPVVVLLHGFSASAHSWDAWAARLRQDYHLIIVDLPGHGLTSAPSSYHATDEALRNTLADFIRARGLEHFSLVGHSMGGRIAWEYALAFPDRVSSLVLVDSAGWPDPRIQGMANSPGFQALQNPTLAPLISNLDMTAGLRQILQNSFSDPALANEAMVQRYAELACAPGHRTIMMSLLQDSAIAPPATAAQLAALRMPTLIIWGAEDHVTAPSFGEQFRDAIQNSQLVEIERTGHFPQEEKPDESAAALRAFLRINAQATPQTAQDSEALEPPSP